MSINKVTVVIYCANLQANNLFDFVSNLFHFSPNYSIDYHFQLKAIVRMNGSLAEDWIMIDINSLK